MRFIVDECTGPLVAQWLVKEQYEVFSVYEKAKGISDDEIISKAYIEDWIIITNDKDFGEKVNLKKRPHRGIIFLRLSNERTDNKIKVLKKIASRHHPWDS